ncbi:hypothetical protein MRB53_026778 [Persea americana]|uniref:Uncharacterized protein n=1 Tax=Persea americana TaxID=3435 RepID=A0ACC2LJ62_PERAE|nr:hypothetical protein MRB53_026778 [Persea americana]
MFPVEFNKGSKALVVTETEQAVLWHHRYGHLHSKGLKVLSTKEMVLGLPEVGEFEVCEGCLYGKQTRASFPTGKAWRASKILELLHADLCGPMSTSSLGGKFKESMMQQFEMTDLGRLKYFLGLEISQDESGIFMSQKKYATELLKKFNIRFEDGAKTPMNTGEKLQKEDGTGKGNEKEFRSLVYACSKQATCWCSKEDPEVHSWHTQEGSLSADLFTKALSSGKHQFFVEKIGVREL